MFASESVCQSVSPSFQTGSGVRHVWGQPETETVSERAPPFFSKNCIHRWRQEMERTSTGFLAAAERARALGDTKTAHVHVHQVTRHVLYASTVKPLGHSNFLPTAPTFTLSSHSMRLKYGPNQIAERQYAVSWPPICSIEV